MQSQGGTAAVPTVGEIFDRTDSQVMAVLAELPGSPLEARRVITRELGFDPGAEQLQTIFQLAHESPLSGPLGELPRRLLALRVRAARVLASLLGGRPLEPQRIRQDAEIITEILDQSTRLGRELRAIVAVADLPHGTREFLLRAGDALKAPVEELLAALAIAPRLEQFAAAPDLEALHEEAPSLSGAEAGLVFAALHDTEAPDAGPSRMCVDALALRCLIEEDLDAWEGFRRRELARLDAADAAAMRPATPTAETESPDPAEAVREGESLLRALRRDRLAYEVVSRRLQRQQDAALVAGLDDAAEELRRVGRTLFSAYLRLRPALLGDATEDSVDEADVTDLLARSGSSEVASAAQAPTSPGDDEPFLGAFAGTGRPEIAEAADELRRERRRMRIVTAIAAVLAVAALAVNLTLLAPIQPGVLPQITEQDIAPFVPVRSVYTIAPVVVSQVDSWGELDESERRARTQRIGDRVSVKGVTAVHVLDERGRLVAIWSRRDGVKLVDSTPH